MLRYTVNTPKIDPSPTLHKITPDKIVFLDYRRTLLFNFNTLAIYSAHAH